MKFELGQYVEIIKPPVGYSGYTEPFIGAIGKIVSFMIDTVGGSETDPEIIVRFEDGSQDMFWEEELLPFMEIETEDAKYEANSSIYNKRHRWEIATASRKCTLCPPHGGENVTRHKPKPDRYKNKR